ncbi:MAG TPA: DAK2 domain-containing protein [Gaiellaceae bacterium]|nr:DAK2 domain-containing protein [Gaiellaceae bacterium]
MNSGLNGDLDALRLIVTGALASLEANRERIDDLNVYPVPDGDTGTNLTMTVRAVVEAVDRTSAASRQSLARDVARGALMGARGNSGVILSQIVRGAADVLGGTDMPRIDAQAAALALRGASDAAYRAVRRPVEGTMLSVIRELAEEAEARAGDGPPIGDLLVELVRRGESAVARTPEQLAVLREAGVVDAGGAGLLELVRGVSATVSGEPLPAPAAAEEHLGFQAIHQELSRYRYCTVFLVEGHDLDRDALEAQLEKLGDSLLVVGDASALKVHVHTDDPGAALSLGVAVGTIDGVEIANMHEQTHMREDRLLAAVPDPPAERATTGVVAVVAGAGNRKLFEVLADGIGPVAIVEGGQTMNPSTADLLAAIESLPADEAIVLPNNSNIVLAAEHAAAHASRPAQVVASDSIPSGLAAMVAFDGARTAEENAAEMREAIAAVAAGEVTIASRDVQLNGLEIRKGSWLGLADGEPVAGGDTLEDVAFAVAERLLAEPRDLLTILSGADAPPLDALLARIADAYPDLDVDVHEGGQPHYHLLLSAE